MNCVGIITTAGPGTFGGIHSTHSLDLYTVWPYGTHFIFISWNKFAFLSFARAQQHIAYFKIYLFYNTKWEREKKDLDR